MDPVSALIGAMILSAMFVMGAWTTATTQAAAERKNIGEAIVAELARRRDATASAIWDRLQDGYQAGPAYPIWWAWAAVRTGRAIRRVMRERQPLRRIARASWRGARFAWQHAREHRDERGRPLPLRVGLCELCGLPAAETALGRDLARDGRILRMCAACRWNEREGQPVPDSQPPREGERPEAPPVVVAEPPGASIGCTGCMVPLTENGCENQDCPSSPLHMPAPRGGLPLAEYPAAFRLPLRFCPSCRTQLMPSTWCAVNATNADICLFCALGKRDGAPALAEGAWRERSPIELAAAGGEPLDECGNPVAMPRSTRMRIAAEAHRIALAAAAHDSSRAALPAITTGNDDHQGGTVNCANGEVHTQADWAGQSGVMADSLAGITTTAENTLKCLTAKEAGRAHMSAVKEWSDRVAACMGTGRAVISDVNTRQDPYVDAVQAAGGSGEVARPDFYDEM